MTGTWGGGEVSTPEQLALRHFATIDTDGPAEQDRRWRAAVELGLVGSLLNWRRTLPLSVQGAISNQVRFDVIVLFGKTATERFRIDDDMTAAEPHPDASPPTLSTLHSDWRRWSMHSSVSLTKRTEPRLIRLRCGSCAVLKCDRRHSTDQQTLTFG